MITHHENEVAGKSQCRLILDTLKTRAGAWVAMPHLYKVSGSMAVHSRVADLRKNGHNIQNEKRRHGRKCFSYYRLIE